ncbi:MAG: hypothetical protein ABEJ31_04045 [Haloarculaceae archaeon]
MIPHRSAVVPALLACLLLVAGCTAPDAAAPPTGNVSVTVHNDADRAYDVSLLLVTGSLDGVDVTYRNGTERTVAVAAPAALPRGALDGATNVTVRSGAVERHDYRLPPGSGRGATYEVPDRNATVVYTLAPAGGPVRAWGTTTCSASPTLELAITIGSDGANHVATTCRD